MAKKTVLTTSVTYTCDTCGAEMDTSWARMEVLVGHGYPDSIYCGVEIADLQTAAGTKYNRKPDLCANCVRQLLMRAIERLPKEA
jgi:hypothetical protein